MPETPLPASSGTRMMAIPPLRMSLQCHEPEATRRRTSGDAAIDRRRRAGCSAPLARRGRRRVAAAACRRSRRDASCASARSAPAGIGGTVGGLWVKAGHPVMFSSREPRRGQELATRLGPPARAGTVEEAIAFGDVVFFAVPYGAMAAIGRDHGAALKGKIVLDCGNAVAARDGADRRRGRLRRHRRHVAEVPARHAPRARVQHHRLHDHRQRGGPARPEAADPDRRRRRRGASKVAAALVRDAGFEPVVVGGLAEARRFQRGAPGLRPERERRRAAQKLRCAP